MDSKMVLTEMSSSNTAELCVDFLRIFLGIGLFLKGLLFIFNPQDLTAWLSQGNLLVVETIISHYVVLAHVTGGFLMALGLLTRLSTIAQIPVILGAVFFVHLKEGLFTANQNLEFTILILILLILVSISGPHRFSLDRYIFSDKESSL